MNDLTKREAATLVAELQECLLAWAQNVARMAAIVKRLDELGVEVTVDNSILPYIRLIAHGQLSARAFTQLSCEPSLLDKVMRLPLPLQEQAANNEPFKVMATNGDHRMVRPLDMTLQERRQVFHGKRLRNDAEQVGWLREQSEKEAAKTAVRTENPITLDRRRGGIIANGLFIPVSDLASFVASLSR